jgi:hypothetical protein
MTDKVKVPSGPAAMRLVHADLYSLNSTCYHIASQVIAHSCCSKCLV